MSFWKNFLIGAAEGAATSIGKSILGGLGEKTDLGTMLTEGTQKDFDEYLDRRRSAVKGEYDKYVTKFDAFEEQAKQFAALVGSPSSDQLGTELDGMEAAARIMQGKSTAQVNGIIEKLKALRDQENKSLRDIAPHLFKRGADQEIRSYTSDDIARMQVGGAFKYTPQPYDLSKRRTGMARFLRDDMGLFGETFAKQRADVAERQASAITDELSGYQKYASTGQYDRAQAALSLAGVDLRTASTKRGIEKDIAETEKAKFDYDQAKIKAEQDIEKFNLDIKRLKGEAKDAETNRRLEATKRYLAGEEEMYALDQARKTLADNPSVENERKVREAEVAYDSVVRVRNFYKNTSARVDELKSLDKRFSTNKTASAFEIQGMPTIRAYDAKEAREAEIELWQQATLEQFSAMAPQYRNTTNLLPVAAIVGRDYVTDMRDYANVSTSGRNVAGSEATPLEIIVAGVDSTFPDLSAEEKAVKKKRVLQFAKDRGFIKDQAGGKKGDTQQQDTKIQPSDVDVGDVNRRFTIPEGTGSEEGLSTEDIARAERLRDRRKGQIKNLMGQIRMMNEDGKARVRGLIGTYETEIDNLVRKYGIER